MPISTIDSLDSIYPFACLCLYVSDEPVAGRHLDGSRVVLESHDDSTVQRDGCRTSAVVLDL